MRIERDMVGSQAIDENVYYGLQSLRAKENFHITGRKQSKRFTSSLAEIKKAAALVNGETGHLPAHIRDAIVQACDEILEGKLADQFITDPIQGGAGTSYNMNMNEVVANRAIEILGGQKGDYTVVHPNDHVNMSQSTNDVIPTAGRLTVLKLADALLKNLDELTKALTEKAQEFDSIIKMGRTQLEDAVPIRLGQEFHAYASALKRDYKRIKNTLQEMYIVNMGGTAIGTCVNAETGYVSSIVDILSEECGRALVKADDLIDATQNADPFVAVSGSLKACAVSLSKMSNDLRLMSSGPKTGFGEITLPAKQNGSSIMPGKVNPVIPEVVSQVAFLVIGNDMTITMAAEAGQLELNAFEPVILNRLFESIICLTNAIKTFTVNCVRGIVANEKRCIDLMESSVGVVTALCPYLGYKKSAEIAKEALAKNMRVKDLILEYNLIDPELLEQILDPYSMT